MIKVFMALVIGALTLIAMLLVDITDNDIDDPDIQWRAIDHGSECMCFDCYHDDVYIEAVAEFDSLFNDLTYTRTTSKNGDRITIRRSNGRIARSHKVKVIA